MRQLGCKKLADKGMTLANFKNAVEIFTYGRHAVQHWLQQELGLVLRVCALRGDRPAAA